MRHDARTNARVVPSGQKSSVRLNRTPNDKVSRLRLQQCLNRCRRRNTTSIPIWSKGTTPNTIAVFHRNETSICICHLWAKCSAKDCSGDLCLTLQCHCCFTIHLLKENSVRRVMPSSQSVLQTRTGVLRHSKFRSPFHEGHDLQRIVWSPPALTTCTGGWLDLVHE